MRPGMQVELWARNAPRTHVAAAAVGTVLVAALLAGSLITSGGANSPGLSTGLASPKAPAHSDRPVPPAPPTRESHPRLAGRHREPSARHAPP